MPRALTYDTNGAVTLNHHVDGKTLTDLSKAELVAVVIALIEHAILVQGPAGSAGFERRALMAKPPEERKPGAHMIDAGGIR